MMSGGVRQVSTGSAEKSWGTLGLLRRGLKQQKQGKCKRKTFEIPLIIQIADTLEVSEYEVLTRRFSVPFPFTLHWRHWQSLGQRRLEGSRCSNAETRLVNLFWKPTSNHHAADFPVPLQRALVERRRKKSLIPSSWVCFLGSSNENHPRPGLSGPSDLCVYFGVGIG